MNDLVWDISRSELDDSFFLTVPATAMARTAVCGFVLPMGSALVNNRAVDWRVNESSRVLIDPHSTGF
jgi:hypothetical protein